MHINQGRMRINYGIKVLRDVMKWGGAGIVNGLLLSPLTGGYIGFYPQGEGDWIVKPALHLPLLCARQKKQSWMDGPGGNRRDALSRNN